MPIRRIDDKGHIVPDKAEALLEESRQKLVLKNKRVKIMSFAIGIGTLLAAAVFQFVSHDLGIFTAVAVSSAASVVNLYLD